jgi:hypothetical protein
MKILIVTHDSNFSGGANRSLYTNIKVLHDKYNVEIVVLLPSSNGALNKKLDEIGIPWMSVKYFGVVSGLRHDGKDIPRRLKVYLGYYIEKYQAKIVASKIKKQKFDLIYTNTRLPMIGANIAKILNLPHVSHVREFGTVEPLWGKWDFKTMYDNCDKIILISNALKNQFLEHVSEDKLIVSHNGIQYDPVEYADNNLESDELHLILTGRLVPDKGHKDAIMAVYKILNNNMIGKKPVVHFVGSSPKRTHIEWYEKELRKMVSDLGLADNIIFEGEVSDMQSIRSNMDIELMCAIRETFGRVTIEAMRSGLLIIGANTGATPELIEDGKTGYLYRQGDSDDLAEIIVKAISDKDKFNDIRRNALDYASNNFDVGTNCDEIYQILSECTYGED